MINRKTFLTAFPLFIFALLAIAFYFRIGTGEPQILPSALIGKTVPQFNLPPLAKSGVPGLKNDDFPAGSFTLVNVWASWCVPCRAEHPLLVSLSKKTGKSFQLVGINYKDQQSAARNFLKEFGNPYSRIGVDSNGRAAIDWGLYGVPETFLVNGRGRIVFKHVGPLNADVIEKSIIPYLKKTS